MEPTTRLGLDRPDDGNVTWGEAYRSAMAALDGYAGRCFIQNAQPTVPGPYLWVQTGLGPDGTDHTLWIEDGV